MKKILLTILPLLLIVGCGKNPCSNYDMKRLARERTSISGRVIKVQKTSKGNFNYYAQFYPNPSEFIPLNQKYQIWLKIECINGEAQVTDAEASRLEEGNRPEEDTSAPPGTVWSEEHAHYHDIQPSNTPIPSDVQRSLNVPQPEGPTPEGKIWSTEHGHWHEITPTSNPLSESTSTNIPQPKGSVPEGKEWSSEHGHWHDIEK
jgi:hypothetical protein